MNPRKLWIYYTAAIATILALLVAGHVIHVRVISLGAQDEETINISGRQRMLSQRVLLTATKFAGGGDPMYASTLTRALDTMEQGQKWLLEHSVNSPAAQKHYLAPEGVQLDVRTREYIALGRSLLIEANGRFAQQTRALFVQMEGIALNDLLRDLNAAVGIFDAEANGRTKSLEMLQRILLFAAIGILLLEAFFVFRPAHRAVVQALDITEARNRELILSIVRTYFKNSGSLCFHKSLCPIINQKFH